MSLLSGVFQTSLLTVFSSTSHPAPSPLWTVHTDPSLPDDSLVTVLPDSDKSSSERPTHSSRKIRPTRQTKGTIVHPVLHIQSPSIKTTYIQLGQPSTEAKLGDRHETRVKDAWKLPLGIELGWLALQVRRLGRRHWSLEIGLLDASGREGIIRCSTFQEEPSLHSTRSPPLLHLPLKTPDETATTLTPWLDISISLKSLISLFQRLPEPNVASSKSEDDDHRPRKRRKEAELPRGQLGSVSYIRVYANCRLRRIWFTNDGPRTLEQLGTAAEEEFGLFATTKSDLDEG